MMDKDKILQRLHSMHSNDVNDLIKKALLDSGIEPCNNDNGINDLAGFSLTEHEVECEDKLTVPPNNPLNPSSSPQFLCGKYCHYKVKGRHLAHYPECCPENCPLLNEDLITEFVQ